MERRRRNLAVNREPSLFLPWTGEQLDMPSRGLLPRVLGVATLGRPAFPHAEASHERVTALPLSALSRPPSAHVFDVDVRRLILVALHLNMCPMADGSWYPALVGERLQMGAWGCVAGRKCGFNANFAWRGTCRACGLHKPSFGANSVRAGTELGYDSVPSWSVNDRSFWSVNRSSHWLHYEWPSFCKRIVFTAKAAGGVSPIGLLQLR